MGELYAAVLEQAQAVRASRIVNRSSYRRARLKRFMRDAKRVLWRRQGRRVTWR